MRRSYIVSFLIVVFVACVGAQAVMLVGESVPETPSLTLGVPRRAPMQILSGRQDNSRILMGDVEEGKTKLLGALEEPLGTWILIEGEVVALEAKGKGAPVMFNVFRMNGKWLSTPKEIELFEGATMAGPLSSVANMQKGQFYRLVGYEYVWFEKPMWVYQGYEEADRPKETPVSVNFVPVTCEPMFRLVEAMEKSVDQAVLLVGQARSEKGSAYIVDRDQKVLVDSAEGWPKEWEGKEIQVQGVLHKDEDQKHYSITPNLKELVDLEIQAGKPVRLRGLLWVGKSPVFLYRGTPVYLSGDWPAQLHGQKVVIEGQLDSVPSKEMSSQPQFGRTGEMAYRLSAVKITPASTADR
jgi:hypothetical protein